MYTHSISVFHYVLFLVTLWSLYISNTKKKKKLKQTKPGDGYPNWQISVGGQGTDQAAQWESKSQECNVCQWPSSRSTHTGGCCT